MWSSSLYCMSNSDLSEDQAVIIQGKDIIVCNEDVRKEIEQKIVKKSLILMVLVTRMALLH